MYALNEHEHVRAPFAFENSTVMQPGKRLRRRRLYRLDFLLGGADLELDLPLDELPFLRASLQRGESEDMKEGRKEDGFATE